MPSQRSSLVVPLATTKASKMNCSAGSAHTRPTHILHGPPVSPVSSAAIYVNSKVLLRPLPEGNGLATASERTDCQSGMCAVSLRSVWGQCGASLQSVWDQCVVRPCSVWGSVSGQSRVRLRSIWGQAESFCGARLQRGPT